MVLHEPDLHEFHVHQLLQLEHNPAAYGRELGYALGSDELRRAQRGIRTSLQATPLIRRLLDVSLGVIVHSTYAADRIRALRPALTVDIVPQFAAPPQDGDLRKQLPWPANVLVFGTIGFLAANKRVDAALDAFAAVHTRRPEVRYLLVGEAPDPDALRAAVAARGLSAVVHHEPYVPDLQTFARWVNSIDVLVALRDPTLGETSATVLRGLAAGRPLVVYNHGWYAELPDSVLKVAPGNAPALLAALSALVDDPQRRQRMGAAARARRPAASAPSPLNGTAPRSSACCGAGGPTGAASWTPCRRKGAQSSPAPRREP